MFLQVVWVHVYNQLDIATLFKAQRVCKRWRNMINQPIVWYDRSKQLEEWFERHKKDITKGIAEWWGVSEDETVTLENDPEQNFGPSSVANLKRVCKTLYVKKMQAEQHFAPKNAEVGMLVEAASIAPEAERFSKWEEALEMERCGRILFDRARTYEGVSRFDEAIRDYCEAVAICPYDYAIRTRLGLTYHKMGDLQNALRNYLKTAALAPTYQLAWNNAGSIFFNTGFYERAEQCFSRCIMLDKAASIAYNNRGLCRFLAGDGQLAVEDFSHAFYLNQADRTARPNRAAAHNLMGNYDMALDDCLSELGRVNLEPDSASAALPYIQKHMGVAYFWTGTDD